MLCLLLRANRSHFSSVYFSVPSHSTDMDLPQQSLLPPLTAAASSSSEQPHPDSMNNIDIGDNNQLSAAFSPSSSPASIVGVSSSSSSPFVSSANADVKGKRASSSGSTATATASSVARTPAQPSAAASPKDGGEDEEDDEGGEDLMEVEGGGHRGDDDDQDLEESSPTRIHIKQEEKQTEEEEEDSEQIAPAEAIEGDVNDGADADGDHRDTDEIEEENSLDFVTKVEPHDNRVPSDQQDDLVERVAEEEEKPQAEAEADTDAGPGGPLVRLSSLPKSRWANLSNIDLIRVCLQREKRSED